MAMAVVQSSIFVRPKSSCFKQSFSCFTLVRRCTAELDNNIEHIKNCLVDKSRVGGIHPELEEQYNPLFPSTVSKHCCAPILVESAKGYSNLLQCYTRETTSWINAHKTFDVKSPAHFSFFPDERPLYVQNHVWLVVWSCLKNMSNMSQFVYHPFSCW